MLRYVAIKYAIFAALVFGAAVLRADDDPIPPPVDPGPGFEGLLPAPELPRRYRRDEDTIPYGVQSVANTPVLHLGQSFRPSLASIDWVAFVFQNTVQPSDPNEPGAGTLQVSLYTGINQSDGQLSGLLGTTDEVSIPSQTTGWLTFHFPESIPLNPGSLYYLHVRQTGGYQSWVGIRHQNIYMQGSAFGYFYDTVFNNPPQRLNWNNYDLHFATGIHLPPLWGDYNDDGAVDAGDYVTWRNRLGDEEPLINDDTAGVDVDDYARWKSNFGLTQETGGGSGGLVPEPTPMKLLVFAALGRLPRRVRAEELPSSA